MKTLIRLIDKLFGIGYVGDLSKHRLHTTRYEDLCK